MLFFNFDSIFVIYLLTKYFSFMKKSILSLLLLVAIAFSSTIMNAQTYKSAIGARVGYPLAASYKHFFTENIAGEAIGGFRGFVGYSYFSLGALVQYHKDLGSVEGLRWYAGGGASAYFWRYNLIFTEASNTSFGISGCVGLDYKFADFPVNITFDWVPTIFINGYDSGFRATYGGLGVRYVLK